MEKFHNQLHTESVELENLGLIENSQNYWVFGLFPSSGILENTMFRKLDLFPSSGEGGGEDTGLIEISSF
jgi:hypothetical protein